MLKKQGKSRQSNIFELVALDLKNLMGGVDMCFELMTTPLPFLHRATIALCFGTAGNSQDRDRSKMYLMKFDASQSHFITTHRFTKTACFPFCKTFFFLRYK